MKSRASRTLALAFAAWAAGTGAHADDWEFKSPTGKVEEALKASNTRIEGLPAYEQRFDGLVETGISNGTYGAKLAPWAWTWIRDNQNGTKPSFELREAWVERVSDNWDVRVGNQILSWASADTINPTDVWNARDLTDPLASTKLPIAVAQAKIHPAFYENVSLELDFTPFFRPSRLPFGIPDSGTAPLSLSDSRWLLPAPAVAQVGDVSAPLQYQVTSASYPETWQGGARLSLLRVGGWDFSGSIFNGVETLPRFAYGKKGVTNDPSLPVLVTLNPSYHRTQMVGVDGAGSWGDVGLRFEGAFFTPDNSRAVEPDLWESDYFQTVTGADYTFKQKLLGSVTYLNVMYVHRQDLQSNPQTTVATIEGLPNTQAWDDDAVLYMENRFGQKFKLASTLIASLRHGDALISPSAQYKLMDGLRVALGAELLVGNSSGFFGQMSENSRTTLSASYTF